MAAANGPMMEVDLVRMAAGEVQKAITQIETVKTGLTTQAGMAQAVMIAPAGGVTATNYQGHAAGAQVLSETLNTLYADLNTTINVLLGGSDQATAAAHRGAPGGIAAQMV